MSKYESLEKQYQDAFRRFILMHAGYKSARTGASRRATCTSMFSVGSATVMARGVRVRNPCTWPSGQPVQPTGLGQGHPLGR